MNPIMYFLVFHGCDSIGLGRKLLFATMYLFPRTQFHENFLARTVLNAGNFLRMAKRVIICDFCFHNALDQPLVKR